MDRSWKKREMKKDKERKRKWLEQGLKKLRRIKETEKENKEWRAEKEDWNEEY